MLDTRNDGLYYESSDIIIRTTGLKCYNLDRLYVTLKLYIKSDPNRFHIDTIDLYNQRQRDKFIDSVKLILSIDQKQILSTLNDLICQLELYRVDLIEGGRQNASVELTESDEKEAIQYLKDKNLIGNIKLDLHNIGVIGEDNNKLLCYLTTISRLHDEPLGILILSRSGAGKTHLQNSVCKLVPPESLIQYTRLTGQSLFYREKNDLKNKVMSIEEDEGLGDALYSIRTLQSNQKISIATTRSNAQTGRMNVDEYTVEGPVSFFISTTNPDSLDPETRSRFLILTVDESHEHTQRIHQIKLMSNTVSGFHRSSIRQDHVKKHHNIHRVLKPLIPLFPDDIEIVFPHKHLQMRREFGKFISLVKSITLLFQYQRVTKEFSDGSGYVLIDKQDVVLAIELGRDVFNRSIDDIAPPSRKLLDEICQLIDEKRSSTTDNEDELTFTRKELRERIHWSEAQVRKYLYPLVKLDYIKPTTGKNGSRYNYELVENVLGNVNYFSEDSITYA